jgi:hypothetical protein
LNDFAGFRMLILGIEALSASIEIKTTLNPFFL